MKSHKAAKHNIGVVWHMCDIKGCDFQSKQGERGGWGGGRVRGGGRGKGGYRRGACGLGLV